MNNDKALIKLRKILIVLLVQTVASVILAKLMEMMASGPAGLLLVMVYLFLLIPLSIFSGVVILFWIKDKWLIKIILGIISAILAYPLTFMLGTQIANKF